MSNKSTNNTTTEDSEKLLNDENCCQIFELPQNEAPGNANESSLSTGTSPGLLSMVFMNDTTSTEQSQPCLSQQQSQNTKEASAAIHGLINTISEEEHEMIGLPKTPARKSTGTMPKTPTMVSTGTMPRTPTMTSTGTMPRTPTMTSTGTMPRTPRMVSTTAWAPGSINAPIDLVSPTVQTIETVDLCSPGTPIDLVSPTVQTIETVDLCSPYTPTNTGSSK